MALSALLQDCANKVCYSHDIARMLQGCQHKIVTILLYQACNGRVRTTLSPGQTRKHCCGNICDSRCFIKCFPVCPPVETLLRKQNLLPEKQKCFLVNSETFDVSLCFSLMFPSVCPLLETWRNIGRKQCFLVCPWLYNKTDSFDKVVTSCQQVVPNLLTTCDKQCEYILLTACLSDMSQDVRFLRV
jgi:hypothetical protein